MSIREDLNYGLAAFGIQVPAGISIDDWAAKLAEKPAQNTVALVALASAVFYAAERGRNPRVRDVYDALIYCTTNLSVGYSDIFARTPIGKIVGSVLMVLGPSMAAKATDGPTAASSATSSTATRDTQEQILATLRQILGKLEPPAGAGAGGGEGAGAAAPPDHASNGNGRG
jgi:hypothetical protein